MSGFTRPSLVVKVTFFVSGSPVAVVVALLFMERDAVLVNGWGAALTSSRR